MREADYVVVGAGAAGCVVAARLSEDPGTTVLVLEAGPTDGSVLIRMPAAVSYPLRRKKWIWDLATGPEPHLGGRSIPHARGRVLGGSSSVNGMVYTRGNPRDFDDWAKGGAEGWSYADCLPYFKRLESFGGEPSVYRGAEGPMGVTRMPADHAIFAAMIEAAEQYGLPYNDDYNGFRQEGVRRHQANIVNGRRASAARAYLHPAMTRDNLEVVTGAEARRIRFDAGPRAVGVSYAKRGDIHRVVARREVILCAGTYKSPHLLLLSGVGAGDHLRAHDIPVVANLPAVGRHLKDHLGVGIGHHAARRGVSPGIHAGLLGRGLVAGRWAITGRGLGASNFWETGAFLKSAHTVPRADIQHEFLPVAGGLSGGELRLSDGFRYSVSLMRPRSQGAVELASADPAAPPRIVHHYLSAPDDLALLRDGVRRTCEIVRQRAWDALRGPADGEDVASLCDDALDAWIRRTGTTFYHPTSSCRMGTDERSVVDSEGRVHGVQGLRVIDASVMPDITSGNTHCPTLMLAEKLSDAIRSRRLPPEPQPYAP